MSKIDEQKRQEVWREFWGRFVGKNRSRLEAHQRIRIYNDALIAGHTHEEAYALAVAPDAQLPDIVFEIAGRTKRKTGCNACKRCK